MVALLVSGLVVSWRASDVVIDVVLAAVGGLLSVGGVRAAASELRTRRSRPDGDAAQLAGLTHIPSAVCAGGLLLVCLAAAVGGAWLLVTSS